MTILKEEKEYFRECFNQIQTEEDFKNIIYELYIIHKYSYVGIKAIVCHVFRKINIQDVIKIVKEFDVKICSKGENCKSPTGCIQPRENFYNHDSTDGKKSICISCHKFNHIFKKANQIKQNHILKFQEIKDKDKQDEFLINLYKTGFSTIEMTSISLREFDDMIKLLKEYNIKRCSQGENCKSPNGCIQPRENFNKNKQCIDGKHYMCSSCERFNDNFKNANQIKQNYMLEFQTIKEKDKQDEFLIDLYKKQYTVSELSGISLQNNEYIDGLLRKYDIKRCSQCKIIKSQKEFAKTNNKSNKLQWVCKTCKHKNYLDNIDEISEYRKKYYLLNYKKHREYCEKHAKKIGKYDIYAPQIDFVNSVRRDPNNQELIQVKCKLCKEWFNPTNRQLRARVNAINGKYSIGSESNLYCSQKCKDSCPLYDSTANELITQQRLKNNNLSKDDFQRIQQEVRIYFLKIKNPDKCELCGEKLDPKDLILHHIIPVSIDYVSEADIDNVIFVCKDCHNQTHQIDGCKTSQLAQENNLC